MTDKTQFVVIGLGLQMEEAWIDSHLTWMRHTQPSRIRRGLQLWMSIGAHKSLTISEKRTEPILTASIASEEVVGYIYLHICNNMDRQLHISNNSRNVQSMEGVLELIPSA